MKAPLNTDNWSGSIKSSKAPLNTDDWNGFISAEMSRKLSQNCQCITTPCNCGVIEESTGESSTPIKIDDGSGVWHKLKNNKLLIYGLIAVAGYFAYKKFKK